MKYLGIIRKEDGRILLPDAVHDEVEDQHYEAISVGGNILLTPTPLDRERLARVNRLAERSVEEHRKSLEGLAQ